MTLCVTFLKTETDFFVNVLLHRATSRAGRFHPGFFNPIPLIPLSLLSFLLLFSLWNPSSSFLWFLEMWALLQLLQHVPAI